MFDERLAMVQKTAEALLPAMLIACCGSAVKYLRMPRKEPFSWKKFVTAMVVAAFTGSIINSLCLGASMNDGYRIAVVGMAGYGGGSTLDLLMSVVVKKVKGE